MRKAAYIEWTLAGPDSDSPVLKRSKNGIKDRLKFDLVVHPYDPAVAMFAFCIPRHECSANIIICEATSGDKRQIV